MISELLGTIAQAAHDIAPLSGDRPRTKKRELLNCLSISCFPRIVAERDGKRGVISFARPSGESDAWRHEQFVASGVSK